MATTSLKRYALIMNKHNKDRFVKAVEDLGCYLTEVSSNAAERKTYENWIRILSSYPDEYDAKEVRKEDRLYSFLIWDFLGRFYNGKPLIENIHRQANENIREGGIEFILIE